MKKIIIVFLCCVLLAGCGNDPASTKSVVPTTSEPIVTEESTNTTTAPTIEEPAEKEKPSEKSILSEAAETPSTVTPPETKPPATTALSEPPTEETTKPEPIVIETVAEETAPPEADPADIEKLVVKYINQYRTEQGDTATTMLPGLTAVARYRAEQIITDFSHNSIPDACTVLQYGDFIDMTLYGGIAEDSYYRGYSREAIGKGDWFGTADQMAERIASGFRNSAGHWSYVGRSQYPYIAVGIVHAENKWHVCICMSAKNYGG